MDEELAGRQVPPSHRAEIVLQIYDDKTINRAYMENILDTFQSLPWEFVEMRKDNVQQSPDQKYWGAYWKLIAVMNTQSSPKIFIYLSEKMG